MVNGIEFIPDVDNNIADAMSRLCRNNMIDSPTEFSEENILSAISQSSKLDKQKYTNIGKMHNSFVGHFGLERTLKGIERCLEISTTTH